jgi:hypothetical protein
MWIAAVVAHYPAGDGALSLLPVSLLGSLAVSYVTRPANRGGSANDADVVSQIEKVLINPFAGCSAAESVQCASE